MAIPNRVLDLNYWGGVSSRFSDGYHRSSIRPKKLFRHLFRCSEFIQLPHSRMSWHKLSIGQMLFSAHGCLKTTGIIRF